jgi:hypothetical protein
MNPIPGSPPEIFYFTVRDDAVVKRIQGAEGEKVALHYQEKRGVPSSCFGDTRYFISDVRVLGQWSLGPPLLQRQQVLVAQIGAGVSRFCTA